MRIDAYTKGVLTIIAVCLLWLSIGGPSLLPTAHAQTKPPTIAPDHVVIAGWVNSSGQVMRFPSNTTMPVGGLPVSDAKDR